ncbi:16S rRNA (uracil(1498)-N(3))-methyltransferase [Pseudoduganella sp. GCM10020061]|uniref:16S rRNA (uracil(1498)-N(3))-methyltransferase n=1 Tax=Pseudoduganella sp. GCM10020061 TaxID=3317345 RepID=UPI00363D48FF
MPRFYCQQPFSVGQPAPLPPEVAHHIHVLRLAAGDEVTLFNGDGAEYTAQLSEIGKKHAQALVTARAEPAVELAYAVQLAQGLPEGSKMDWIVEKAVELGVASIQPLAARRSVVKLSAERAEKKLAHWQGVIEAASCQSGRTRLAALHAPADVIPWLARPAAGQRILLSPRGTSTLAGWARANAPQPLTLMVGPEGGFSAEEEDAAIAAGALLLTMGARVLRTETAALAALSILQAHWS